MLKSVLKSVAPSPKGLPTPLRDEGGDMPNKECKIDSTPARSKVGWRRGEWMRQAGWRGEFKMVDGRRESED